MVSLQRNVVDTDLAGERLENFFFGLQVRGVGFESGEIVAAVETHEEGKVEAVIDHRTVAGHGGAMTESADQAGRFLQLLGRFDQRRPVLGAARSLEPDEDRVLDRFTLRCGAAGEEEDEEERKAGHGRILGSSGAASNPRGWPAARILFYDGVMLVRVWAAIFVLAVAATARGADEPWRDWWASESALPAMPWRESLAAEGISFSGSFDSYFFGNPIGGESHAFAYTQSLYFQLEADLEKIAGWKGGSLVWSWSDNAGSDLSQTLGNEFQIVGAYGPNTFYFDLLYLQQEVKTGTGTLTARAGQLTALNDFLVTEMCNYYVNEAFQADVLRGIDILATYEPEASWGGFVKYEEPAWYVQSGVFQVSERIGDNSTHGLDYSIQPDDGLIMFLEGCWRPQWSSGKGAYPAHYKVGAFLSTWNYPRYAGGTATSIAGFYALAEQLAWREKERADEGLYAWSSMIYSPQAQVAQIPWFVSGGLQYVGLLPGRDNDRAVFGAAYGAFSMDQAAAQKDAGIPPQYYEIALEASYWIAVNEWMTVTPDVQFIVNPGGAYTIPDALVVGVAVGLSF